MVADDAVGRGDATVLVVDDDEDLADTYALWLEADYEVRTAYGGEAAIEALDDDVDVVLLDRRMPAVPGDDVLDEIDARGIDCQVSMLTAVEPDSDIVDMPFDEYIVKPVSKAEVLEVVDELLFREELDEETQTYLALESTEQTLEERDTEEFRDPAAVAALREDVSAAAAAADESEVRELRRLKEVNSLIRGVDRALVEASSRDEIEVQTCRRLVSEGGYRYAWIGGYVAAFDQFNPRASSEAASLDAPPIDLGPDHPVSRAMETGEVVVTEDADAVAEPDAPLAADGGGPAAVVPLTHEETKYGALVVHADAGHAISDRERTVLGELGDTIANGISAVESKQLLHSDAVVELEFRTTDRSEVLVDLAATVEARVDLEGFAPAPDGAVTCYLTVSGVDPPALFDALAEATAVESYRAIDERGATVQLECSLSGRSVVKVLLDASANVRAMVVEDGVGSLTAEVAPDADPRTVMEAVERAFPATELRAKRDVARPVHSTAAFRSELDDRLTERQRTVIEATYNSGYFEWPRESTAEEVAETFDIAPPTLHEHLREAQRKLIETYLEETE